MEVKYINPFIASVKSVLENFNVTDIRRGKISKKENMHVDMDITSVISLVGEIRGNISYSLSQETAIKIVSCMMGGMEVSSLDEIGRSAIGELSNMITGTACSIFAKDGILADITPPSIIFGSEMLFIISSVETITVDVETTYGKIEINIGLEI